MSKYLLGSAQVALLSLSLAVSAHAQDTLPFEDEIIVTGSPLARSVDEAITGVSVISGADLDQRLASSIGETLKYEPGLSSTFFGAGASRPIIRGQGSDRVRVLTNGIGSIDASSASPDHAVSVEPAQAERIEILRGAGVLRYGSSGAGGIVNVIDERIPDVMPDGTEANLRMSASSVDSGFEAAASIDQAIGNNFALHLDGTTRNANDYRIPDFAESAALRAEEEAEVRGRLPNSFVESQSGTIGLSWIGERAKFGAALHRSESDYGIPGGHAHEDEDEGHDDEDHGEGGEEEDENVTIGLRQTRIDVNGSVDMDGLFERFQVFGGYADYTHTEFEGPGVVGTVFTNEGFEARAELIQAERGNWTAAHGVQLRTRDFAAIGDEAFVPPTTTKQYAAYTFHEWEQGPLHLEGAGRIEVTQQTDDTLNRDVDFTALSVSVGLDRHINDAIRIGGTVFRSERAPSTEELFSNGPHLATEAFEVGDATLGKEVSTGGELAFRHREGSHSLTVNLFYTDYEDFIFNRETGAEEDGLPVFQSTAADAKFYGFEVQGALDLYTGRTWSASVDGLAEYVRAETDAGDLPRIPPLSILAGVEAKTDNLSLRAEVDWNDRQDRTAAFERATQSYTLVNLFSTYRFGDRMTFAVGVHNLLDRDARQHTSFLKDTVPLPGRNVRFTVSAKL
ncbi:TonB-dependent receptor [Algimonas arctica]|uniref:TonB-dependent receptor n=1 Tax=Algimonas arctica TaxID=1479486 RepID=A0A8J3CTR8_9PROT|nr:TonB-dependent receptor [Algimonas arctica]GHB00450.1 TonB-dependent receptor [Algimonas arctica]